MASAKARHIVITGTRYLSLRMASSTNGGGEGGFKSLLIAYWVYTKGHTHLHPLVTSHIVAQKNSWTGGVGWWGAKATMGMNGVEQKNTYNGPY